MTAAVKKLSLVVYSADADKVHYALVMASAAAAVDTPVTLFFTREACRALVPDGWKALPVPGGGTGADLDRDYGEKGIGCFEDLFAACAQLGVRFIVCEMGLKAVGLAFSDLRADLKLEQAGVVTFLNDADPDGLSFFV
jgi:peroxiredoxin family protein